MIIPLEYYQENDTLFLTRDLLGKYLFTKFDGKVTGGMIIETEAYMGPEDKAAHSYNNRRTKRTEVMFHEGGHAYVYLIYGMYSLFNIVTNKEGVPHGVLIRAIYPEVGIETMLKRRNKEKLEKKFSNGPGTLTQALGITTAYLGHPLNTEPIWVEDRGIKIPDEDVSIGPRIGIDYAGEDAFLPWRYCLKSL